MTRVWSKAVWGSAVGFWLMVPAPAEAQYGKVDKSLAQSSSHGSRRVIIRTKAGAKLHVRKQLEAHGGGVLADHNLVDALTARIRSEDLAMLARDPNVESVSLDAEVHASGSSGNRGGSNQRPYGDGGAAAAGGYLDSFFQYVMTVSNIKETLGLSNSITGLGVTVAVIDSGLAPLSDFQGRIVAFYDFTSGRNPVPASPYDDYGHGTHVAGLIGSSGYSSGNRYSGIAPSVKLLPLKVLDRNGAGFTSDVLRALEFAVANKDRYNIRVINLSLGHPIYESAATDPLVQAVERAVRAGIVVVVAAGNCGQNATGSGYGGIASPGNAPSAITVGAANTNGTATRADDRVAPYSSRGPSWYDGVAKPDMLAPGQGLISNEVDSSTLALTYPSLITSTGTSRYLSLSGSSMATGVVSGLTAVMIDAQKRGTTARSIYNLLRGVRSAPAAPLSPNAIKAMLQYSATPLVDDAGLAYNALTQGTGLVNGAGAVSLAYNTDTTKPAGSFWLSTAVEPSTTFGGTATAWAQAMIWGTRLVSGSSVIELNQFAWGDNIVWGTGEFDNIVWGTLNEDDNIVWGTSLGLFDVSWLGNVFLGENIVWGTMDWADNIVWGTGLLGYFNGDNIVWGTFDDDNIVWGTLSDDNIVWGTSDTKVSVLGWSLSGGGL